MGRLLEYIQGMQPGRVELALRRRQLWKEKHFLLLIGMDSFRGNVDAGEKEAIRTESYARSRLQ